ncbi:hypothetical protein EVAR_88855_1 [Eumeta japonica]|uniref:Uncharacterized protein n=1 Tax=Eumeta variegata TaxID=151549 RepID=A0A4C1Y5A1_EUMVA|nr:hypothetical protein EVAR_88855_1 [Eumeta japonica]
MRSLRSMCGVSRKDRCRNSDVRERCGLKEDVVTRVERGMLRWFGHLERMNESRLTKQIYRANVCHEKLQRARAADAQVPAHKTAERPRGASAPAARRQVPHRGPALWPVKSAMTNFTGHLSFNVTSLKKAFAANHCWRSIARASEDLMADLTSWIVVVFDVITSYKSMNAGCTHEKA